MNDDVFLEKALGKVEWPSHSAGLKSKIISACEASGNVKHSVGGAYKRAAMFASVIAISFIMGSVTGAYSQSQNYYSETSGLYTSSSAVLTSQMFY